MSDPKANALIEEYYRLYKKVWANEGRLQRALADASALHNETVPPTAKARRRLQAIENRIATLRADGESLRQQYAAAFQRASEWVLRP